MTTIHFEVEMDEVLAELDRLIKGPDPAVFESAMLQGFIMASDKAHVITGKLKGSGHTSSSYTGGDWEGTIAFVRYPGIYELHRGDDTPTMNHPEGQHFFLNPGGETFTEGVSKALMSFITGGDKEDADEDG